MKKMFKYFFVCCLVLFSFITVNASTNTLDRNEFSNHGVNKRWTIDNSNLGNVLNTPFVDAKEKIYDFSDILSEEDEEYLYDKITEFIEHTGYDFAIVTSELYYYYDSTNEDFAADFYDYNDFGINNEFYDGIVFFRNTYSDPYYTMLFFGKAQLMYDSYRFNHILDTIYPDISNGNYRKGFSDVIDFCTSYYDAGIPSSMSHMTLDQNGDLREMYIPPYNLALIVGLIVAGFYVMVYVKKNKMISKATHAAEYLDSGSVVYSRQEDRFIRSHTSSHTSSSSSGGGGGHYGGGGHSSHGSSGGGHTGGGRHG